MAQCKDTLFRPALHVQPVRALSIKDARSNEALFARVRGQNFSDEQLKKVEAILNRSAAETSL